MPRESDEARRALYADVKMPLHGEFTVTGVPGTKKYVIMPPGDVQDRKMLQQLLQLWGLQKPNLIMQSNDNVTVGSALVTEEMLQDLEDFQQMDAVVKDDAGDKGSSPGTGDPGVLGSTMAKHLESRLVQTLGCVMVAADMTNSWFLSKGYHFTNHIMVEEAMARTKASPTVVVVDDLARYFDPLVEREYTIILTGDGATNTPSLGLAKVLEVLTKQFPSTEGVTFQLTAADQMASSASSPAPGGSGGSPSSWTGKLQVSEDRHMKLGSKTLKQALVENLGEGFTSEQVQVSGGHWNPHGGKARTAMQVLLAGARPWKQNTKDPVQVDFPPEALWRSSERHGPNQLFCNWPWVGGSHYVFTLDPETFNDASLGPSGFILIGGYYSRTKRSIEECINQSKPCILITNTGGETQEYAQLLNAVLQKGTTGVSADTLQQHAQEFLDAALRGQRRVVHTRKHLSKADVLAIIDKHCEIPWLFRERIISVNPLRESPQEILNRLSQCFASTYTNTYEVGAGPADREAVLSSWRLHRHLVANATVHRRRGNAFALLSIALTCLSSSAAIVHTYLKSLGEAELRGLQVSVWLEGAPLHFSTETWMRAMRYLVLILPAVGTLITGIIAFGGWQGKWAALQMAAQRLVTEIYRFRMRVDCYSLQLEEVREDNVSVLMHRSRSLFTKRTQAILQQVTQEDLRTDALEFSGIAQEEELRNHVARSVYSSAAPAASFFLRGPRRASKEAGALRVEDRSARESDTYLLLDDEAAAEGGSGNSATEEDDYVSTLSNEAYFESRVRRLLKLFARKAPRLNFFFVTLQFLVLLCSSLATILAALELETWLPIAVSFAVVFQSLLVHYNLKHWLSGTTSGMGQLQALEMQWSALGAVDRRLMSTRETLTSICEEAALQVVSAETGVVAAPSRRMGGITEGMSSRAGKEKDFQALEMAPGKR